MPRATDKLIRIRRREKGERTRYYEFMLPPLDAARGDEEEEEGEKTVRN